MAVLDIAYVSTLVQKAQGGDSNAFAEFYAATHAQQYSFACGYLCDEGRAQDVLLETYTRALREIHRLSDASMSLAWLNQITLICCLKALGRYEGASVSFPNGENYGLLQIIALPFTQAQSILLSRLCELRLSDIAVLLGVSNADVKRYIQEGRERLGRFSAEPSKGGKSA